MHELPKGRSAVPEPLPPPTDYWQSREEARAEHSRRVAEGNYERRLRGVDAQVRAHEAAHLAAAGPYATTGASYSYMIGPDGQRYAVGGSVGVDLSPIPGNPEATVRKMRAIRRAANAPGQPSSADLRVAAKAYRLEQEAQEKIEERREGGGAAAGERGSVGGEVGPRPDERPTAARGDGDGAGAWGDTVEAERTSAGGSAPFSRREAPPPPGSRIDVAA
jgi:hypothetical protein